MDSEGRMGRQTARIVKEEHRGEIGECHTPQSAVGESGESTFWLKRKLTREEGGAKTTIDCRIDEKKQSIQQ